MVLHAGREIPNSDLKIGETSLGKIRPTFIFHVRPTHSLGNGEASEDHDEDDDDSSKRGADKGINDRGGVGKGGGAAGGGAASGGGMGGNGGSSSAEGGRAGNSGGGAFGVLISRIKVRSTVGHEFTISNTSLETTGCALYESIAERCGMSADAIGVLHSGRELSNDNSELHTTTLGGSHMDKLVQLTHGQAR